MSDVAMPRLSDSMEEGTILKWLKSDGDEVSRGEELVEIETDKANMTYEAGEGGTLEIVASEGDTLAVGATIARIGEGAPDSPEAEEAEPEGPAEEPEPEPEPTEEAPADADRVKASPIARRMASDRGLDLSEIQGTGPGGRIVKADIQAASGETDPEPEPAPEPEPQAATPSQEPKPPARDSESGRGDVTHQELNRLQRTVARRMAESKATAPDFVMTLEVDMEDAVEFRKQLKVAAGDGPAPSFNDLVIKAAALALKDFPRANGAYRDGQFELYSRVNIGIAVAGQDALVVPTVFDADKKSLGTIAGEARHLAGRVRDGNITPPELSSGTFTISNLGMYGIRRFVAVINPPQAAILAVGELSPKAVVRDGELTIRNTMELTLTCDHRILYGAEAAEFLAKIREYLQAPLRLAL
ncbi:2-oxo acid dehydrogenase subunit E2 [Solirubrobacter ginsenosidimutans]|uniref:Dihydrolipoamide acetyltransferase component of pyruvate dehydrogenase complex n=1 Tax=Solirubrobacter ginsenosidimutans TaxID=490573 RepID=A0A9X3N3N5_9ACTN|nr:dihydrolipoamide acetyltransferase family protein [Solirubrobacter ginsenosidimutans]MDA0166385.1 2-oxo acid dehydrogenase subunit E2 [Solirubrobacter ginsenosidimutans]